MKKKPYSFYKDLHNHFMLYELPQIFKVCNAYYDTDKHKMLATADLFIRGLPEKRNFLLAGGVNEIIERIKDLSYNETEINLLLKEGLIKKKFAKYLSKLRFSGDVFAMREGTAFFSNEPVIRVTAPIIQINLITGMVMSLLTADTLQFSKLARLKLVAKNVNLGVGFVRAQSPDSGMRATKYAIILFKSIGSFIASKTFNIPESSVSIAYHAFIKSYDTELEAMRAFTTSFPKGVSVMVDTYDFEKGVRNAIIVAKELKQKGGYLGSITIDSGDLEKRAKYARKVLDLAGFNDLKITVASNLEEYKLEKLLKAKTPIDNALVVTEIVTSADAPTLETVYKISELIEDGESKPVMKLSSGKTSYPGRKQVFRVYKNGKMVKDIIGLEGENLGEALLIPMIKKGKLIRKIPKLNDIGIYTRRQLEQLPENLKNINKKVNYKVDLSPKLNNLIKKVISRVEKTQ
jgi:nicotinate phosphoribosyltransferase